MFSGETPGRKPSWLASDRLFVSVHEQQAVLAGPQSWPVHKKYDCSCQAIQFMGAKQQRIGQLKGQLIGIPTLAADDADTACGAAANGIGFATFVGRMQLIVEPFLGKVSRFTASSRIGGYAGM
jgi:hypothetical protein